MTSRIFANGNRATALSNIAADLPGFISTNADGVKVLDREGLRAYLIAQARLAAAEYVSPADADSAMQAAQSAPVQAIVDSLDAVIGAAHWNTRADWPTTTSVLTSGTIVSAVRAAMDNCQAKAAAVTAYYADVNSALSAAVTAFYYSQGIDSVVPAGVERAITTRSVIYTYVTDKDEESAPSPPSELVDMDQNDTATYTAITPPADRYIDRIRWYRSQSSNSGAAFAFVAEVDVDDLEYLDEKRDEELQEPCPSTTWAEPPEDLRGLVAGPNGAMAGFTGNTLCPCENFVPYAFPVEYQKTTAWPIVGIGTFDDVYVVVTQGKPYFMAGADSASLTAKQMDSMQAGVSRRSIVSGAKGVHYVSAEGICRANAGGVQLITGPDGFNLFDKASWSALVPSSIFAAEHDGTYLFHYNTGSVSGCYALDLTTGKLTTIDATGTAFFRDLLTGTLYLAAGAAIKAMFLATDFRTGVWKSPQVIEAKPKNYGWLQVDSEFEEDVTVKVYRFNKATRAMVLTDTKVLENNDPVRVSSKTSLEYAIQIESAAKITSVTLASTTEELRAL